MATKETLNLLSDKLLREIVTELTEKVHSLQDENDALKSKKSNLRSEVAALRSEVPVKSHSIIQTSYTAKQAKVPGDLAKLKFEAAENEQIMKKMQKFREESKKLIENCKTSKLASSWVTKKSPYYLVN